MSIAALALVVCLGAGVASASQFHADEYPASIKGEATATQNQFLQTAAGKMQCKMAPTSSISGATGTLTISPNYSACRAFGFLSATVVQNSCNYVLKSTNEAAPFQGSLAISCAKPGDAIEVKTIGCIVSLPAQAPAGTVQLENTGSGQDRGVVISSISLTGVKYTKSSGCPSGPGTLEDGVYSTGSSQPPLKASKEGVGVGFYIGNGVVEPPPYFTSSSLPYIVQTSANPIIKGSWGSTSVINCSSAAAEGSVTSLTSSIFLNAAFSGCSGAGVPSVTVAMNSCKLVAHLDKYEGAKAVGTLGISCSKAGDAMVFTYSGCKSSWPAQKGQPVTFEALGSGSTRTVKISEPTAYSMTYTLSGCGSGTYNDGAIIDTWTLAAFNGGQQGLWLS